MEFKRQIENLHKDIQDIERMVAALAGQPGISAIELDVLKMRVQQMYDGMARLKPGHEEESTQEKPAGQPIVEAPETIEMDDSTGTASQDPGGQASGTVGQEQPGEPVQEEPASGMEPVHDKPSGEPANGKKQSEVLADRFKDKQQFRNEHLTKGHSMRDLSSKFDEQPLSDIALGIGLNERFQYIKELFHGSSTEFKETIDYLNKVATEEDAVNYMKTRFNWDMESGLVVRLLHLTRRKLKMNVNG
jgi:hypothetical protein